MDFSHTETRQMLADMLDRWVLNDYPLTDRLEAGQSDLGFAKEKYAALSELGVLGALFSEDAGGFGGQGFDLSVVFEALGKGLVVEPVLQSAALGGGVLASCGRLALVEEIIAGTTIATLAHYEAEDGGDFSQITTKAERDGDGWRLSGAKAVVRAANAADQLIVSAKIDGAVALFLLPAGAAGVSLRDYQTIDGGRAAEVVLDDVKLTSDALLSSEGEAILTEVLGRGILCICAEAVGLMDVIKDMTIEFIQTRKQFGVPIGKFQALQHRMAEMLLEVEQARSSVIRAAAALDQPGADRERAI